MEKKTEYLHIRLSEKEKLQIESLAQLSHYTVSQYVVRLISSTYYKYFDENGDLKNDSK